MPGILSEPEKAYCLGLEAIRNKEYARADNYFKACAELHQGSQGFEIISQAARILAYIELQKQGHGNFENEIKENIENGQETILRRQGIEEETR